MCASLPRVSVGMPVYNGERYLREAIDSVLAQSFTDYELIISDNGSTDATREICEAYAARDPRVRYFFNEVNRGAAWNFQQVYRLARGDYFKWMAVDDICDSRFLEQCVAVLDRMPEVILCYCKTHMIDEDGHLLPDHAARLALYSADPCKRFLDLLRVHHFFFQVQGLIRSRALEKTHLIGNYVSSDNVLLGELSLAGRLYEIPEYLFYCRIHAGQSVQMSRYLRVAWFDPARSNRISFPQWRLFAELWRCIGRSQLPVIQRLRCYLYVLCWPAWNMNWARMAADLLLAFVRAVARAQSVARQLRTLSSRSAIP